MFTMSPALVSILVAALSKHCKIDFFWEAMVDCRHFLAPSWCPSFFSVAVSGAGVVISVQELDKSLYTVYPLLNESALAESIVIQPTHRLYSRSSDSADSIKALTSSLLICGCYDECNNAHMQYTSCPLLHR